MSSWSELLDRPAPEEHFVQLYGRNDQLLTRNVSRYLAEGLRRGDALVVIATREHADAITRELALHGADAVAASPDGRLVVLDAQETLDRFLVGGQPDEHLFREVVGGVLAEAYRRSSTGHVRAFGEMVGLLWVAGAPCRRDPPRGVLERPAAWGRLQPVLRLPDRHLRQRGHRRSRRRPRDAYAHVAGAEYDGVEPSRAAVAAPTHSSP